MTKGGADVPDGYFRPQGQWQRHLARGYLDEAAEAGFKKFCFGVYAAGEKGNGDAAGAAENTHRDLAVKGLEVRSAFAGDD